MSDVTLAVKGILQRQYRLNQHGHHHNTILQQEQQGYTATLLWDYASPTMTAFHASCSNIEYSMDYHQGFYK